MATKSATSNPPSAVSPPDRWGLACIALAGIAAWAPVPQRLVEELYATRFFPSFQPFLTRASNAVSFALFDVCIFVVIAAVALLSVRDVMLVRRAGWARGAWRIVFRVCTIAAASYLAFLLMWGLNYRRIPLGDKLAMDVERVRPAALVELAQRTVERVNALYEDAHREAVVDAYAVDPELARAFVRTQRALGASQQIVPGRPKRTILDAYFRRAGVAGMTDPYFLETLVATDLLAVERPQVIAHEWSHLAGIADEGDANFAGWLTCVHGTPFHQYSGWLFLHGEVAVTLAPDDLRRVSDGLGDGPRRDLQAIRERLLRHVSPRVAAAGWRVYDQYLKANRVEHGAASYGHVVRLVLGATFTDDWTPRLRE